MRMIRYTVPPEDDGRRISNVIRGRLQISHQQFSHIKTTDGMRVNGAVVHANYVVRTGDAVELLLSEAEGASVLPDDAPLVIAYEDEDLLIIDKPAPLPCQSSEKQEGPTLESRMAHHLPDRPFRPVNRLDKGTSGLMAAAKNAHAQMLLSRQLHTPDFAREYLALLEGIPADAVGAVDAPIGKADGATVRREVRPDGKRAVTEYEVLKSRCGLSLVRLRLVTGRTHQIRVHMAHIGCPVYGDFLYGTERPDALPGRFALHSWRMSFLHPMTGERISLVSPLPETLSELTP